MNHHFAVNADLAHRISNFVSTEETRYYLKGVAVDFDAAEGARLVATNGNILGCWLDRDAVYAGDAPRELPIIPSFVVVEGYKLALKAAKPYRQREPKLWIVVQGNSETTSTCKIVMAASAADALAGEDITPLWVSVERSNLVNGAFPDYRRVIPSGMDTTAAAPQFDPLYVAPFAKAIAGLGKPGLRMIGTDPKNESPMLMLSSAAPDFIGVLMPCRASEPAALVASARNVLKSRVAPGPAPAPIAASIDA